MAAPATAHAHVDEAHSAHQPATRVDAPTPLPPLQPTSDFVYATMLIGMPGSMAAAFATMLLMMSGGAGAQMAMWIGITSVFALFFGTMAAGWLAQANE